MLRVALTPNGPSNCLKDSTLSELFLSPASRSASLPDDPFPLSREETQLSDAEQPLWQPRVLLSEDDPDLRAVMRAFLQHEGYDVLACGDGQRALDICREGNAIDLLISDIDMPKLNGIELATEVTRSHAGLPIILISGAELDDTTHNYVAAAGWRFFTKPFTVLELMAAVHVALQRV